MSKYGGDEKIEEGYILRPDLENVRLILRRARIKFRGRYLHSGAAALEADLILRRAERSAVTPPHVTCCHVSRVSFL